MTINKNILVADIAQDCNTNHSFDNFLDSNINNNSYLKILNSYGTGNVKENVSVFQKLKSLLKLAETNLEYISTSISKSKTEIIYLDEPSYFEECFDETLYVKQLVNAKINDYCIVQNRSVPKLHKKLNNLKVNGGMDKFKNIHLLEINADRCEENIILKHNQKTLAIQNLPGINIRSQLMEQKYPQLDIYPDDEGNTQHSKRENIIVVKYQHESDQAVEDKQYESTKYEDENAEQFLGKNKSLDEVSTIKNKASVVSKKSSYIFLNTEPPEPKRIFSRLKKFGLPVIQQIYNPKPSFVSRRSNIKYQPKFYNLKPTTSNFGDTKSIFQSNTKQSDVLPGMSDSNLSKYKKVEYIPYSKLTIRGISSDDIQSHISLFKSTKLSNDNIHESKDVLNNAENNQISVKNKESETSGRFLDETIASTEMKDKMVSLKKIKPLNIKSESFNYVHKIEKKDNFTQYDRFTPTYKSTQTSELEEKELLTIDINKLTLADMMILEKTLSSFKTKMNMMDTVDKVVSSKNTQTSPKKSTHMMTSPAKMIDRNVSPIHIEKKDITTSPLIVVDKSASENDQSNNEQSSKKGNIQFSNGRFRIKKALKKPEVKISSSDTYTDISRSETSEALSLGELNLKIIRKNVVKMLNQSQSTSSTLYSTTINSDTCVNTTTSSKNSEGEILKRSHL